MSNFQDVEIYKVLRVNLLLDWTILNHFFPKLVLWLRFESNFLEVTVTAQNLTIRRNWLQRFNPGGPGGCSSWGIIPRSGNFDQKECRTF